MFRRALSFCSAIRPLVLFPVAMLAACVTSDDFRPAPIQVGSLDISGTDLPMSTFTPDTFENPVGLYAYTQTIPNTLAEGEEGPCNCGTLSLTLETETVNNIKDQPVVATLEWMPEDEDGASWMARGEGESVGGIHIYATASSMDSVPRIVFSAVDINGERGAAQLNGELTIP